MNRIGMRLIALFFFGVIALAVVPGLQQHNTAPVSVQQTATTHVQARNFGPGHLHEHFLKHGYQFGTITEEDYLVGAQKILNDPVGSDLLEKYEADGDIARYKPSTHEFAVMTPSGRIRTYFMAKEGYWDRQ